MPRTRNHAAHINIALGKLGAALIRLVNDSVRSAVGKSGGKVPATRNARKVRPMSPKLRRLRKQQGQFMGLLKSAPKGKHDELKKLRREKGYAAAIAVARQARKKAA